MKRRLNRSAAGNAGILIVLVLFALFMLIPCLYMVLQAFKPMDEIFAYPPRFFVRNPTLGNFTTLWRISDSLWVPFVRYVFNTVFVTAVGMILSLIVSSMAAFPLAKYDFYGGSLLFKGITMALLFTGPVTALPQYIIIAKLGMINTYWAVLLPVTASPLNLFLMKNFMSQLPDSVIEAATIDGAGKVKIFFKICLPLVKPALLTAVIFTFQNFWNSTGGSYIYSEEMKMLPTVLSQITSAGISRVGVGAATALILVIPSMVIFILSQSKVVETMAFSGIKE